MTGRRLYAGEPMRGDYSPFVGGAEARGSDDDYPDEEPAMHWTDGFPHDFHGWGPLTPDYDRDHTPGAAKRAEQEELAQERFRARLRFDDEYLTWRARQLEEFDADYSAGEDESPARTRDTEH